jgi:uncharacterized protein (TIGR02145 family)
LTKIGSVSNSGGSEKLFQYLIMMKIFTLFALLISTNYHAFSQTKRMADGKFWMTKNLDRKINDSYCYDDKEANCKKYGRLYTWQAANEGCKTMEAGWRLPGNEEWQQMAKHYGGIKGEADDDGKAAFAKLIDGGETKFNILLSGGRDLDGAYRRIEAHGFYWTSTATSDSTAWLYNFGNNLKIINHHNDMEKGRAGSVRCVKD